MKIFNRVSAVTTTLTAAVSMTLALATPAQANNGTILEGLVDIPRLAATGPVDGCGKVTKGLINSGGFLVFTCEKLLPYLPISEHEVSFANYQTVLAADGWKRRGGNKNTAKYVKTDAFGCRTQLEVTLWTDRSMNEFPARPATDRDAHRQIVFKAKFFGAACERYYAVAEAMANPYG